MQQVCSNAANDSRKVSSHLVGEIAGNGKGVQSSRGTLIYASSMIFSSHLSRSL
jgi:hypothetical protein